MYLKELNYQDLCHQTLKVKSMLYHYIPQFKEGFLREPCKTGSNSKHERSNAKCGMNRNQWSTESRSSSFATEQDEETEEAYYKLWQRKKNWHENQYIVKMEYMHTSVVFIKLSHE